VSNLESTDSTPTFDDILEAVRDSKRGRWFLQEFEARIQNRESATLLKAIARLESRMESLTAGGATPVELGRVRDAISTARKDLLNLGLPTLSTEGRLFAGLADLARKSLPANDDAKEKIVRSLQLVDEIDRAVVDTGTRYFVADAALFEPVPAAPVPEISVAPESAAPMGAKFIVRKADEAEFEQESASPESTFALDPVSEPAINHPRIMIIRRKAEDMPEVELNEPEGKVSAA
jgi:hypothetical protein